MKILLVKKDGKEIESNLHQEDLEEIHTYYHIKGKHFEQFTYLRTEEFKDNRRIYKQI
jgi:hypothetical protein